MQFPRSRSPGISGVKTSRLFLGERPARTRAASNPPGSAHVYTPAYLLEEDASCWSRFPGEELQPTWTPMCLRLQIQNKVAPLTTS